MNSTGPTHIPAITFFANPIVSESELQQNSENMQKSAIAVGTLTPRMGVAILFWGTTGQNQDGVRGRHIETSAGKVFLVFYRFWSVAVGSKHIKRYMKAVRIYLYLSLYLEGVLSAVKVFFSQCCGASHNVAVHSAFSGGWAGGWSAVPGSVVEAAPFKALAAHCPAQYLVLRFRIYNDRHMDSL